MSDFFKPVKKGMTKDQSSRAIIDPVLYSDPEPDVFFLFSDMYGKLFLNHFRNFIKKSLPGKKICFLYILKFKPKEKELKNIWYFYYKNTIDLKKYIPIGSHIVPIGRSIYGLTYNTDFDVEAFYDEKWNKTYFYVPDLKSYAFPIDRLSKWVDIGRSGLKFFDCFERQFARNQIERVNRIPVILKRLPKFKHIKITDPNKFLRGSYGPGKWALDIEADSLDWQTANIGDVSLSNDGVTGYHLYWKDIDVEVFSEFCKNKYFIIANGMYDIRVLTKRGVKNLVLGFDTMHAGHSLNEARSNRLKSHAWFYTNFGGYELPLDLYKHKYRITNYLDIPDDIRISYSIDDAIILFRVYKAQVAKLSEDPELERLVYEDRLPLAKRYIPISMEGICVNWDEVKKVSAEVLQQLEDVKNTLFEIWKQEVDLNSSPELGKFIEFTLGWPGMGRAKKNVGGYFLANKATLKEWSRLGFKEAELLQKYNSLHTIYSTFLGKEEDNSGIWQYRKPDGRIYPDYAVMMANSLRFKSFAPNFQNQVKSGDVAKLVRRIFTVPSSDYYFVEWDAAGLQLRIVALMSGDPNMRQAFIELGGDMHSMTGQKLFRPDVTLEEFIKNKDKKGFKEKRKESKFVNFSIVFNITARGFGLGTLKNNWKLEDCDRFIEEKGLEYALVDYIAYNNKKTGGIKLTEDDCKYCVCAGKIIDDFFMLYPGVKKWIVNQIEFGKNNGYVRSSFGNRRLLPKLKYSGIDSFYRDIKNMSNICCNSPVQSHEVILIIRAIIKLFDYIQDKEYKSRIVGMIHDAVVMYIHKDELEDLCRKILEMFSIDYKENRGVPMEAEINVADINKGEVWGFGSLKISPDNIDKVFNN